MFSPRPDGGVPSGASARPPCADLVGAARALRLPVPARAPLLARLRVLDCEAVFPRLVVLRRLAAPCLLPCSFSLFLTWPAWCVLSRLKFCLSSHRSAGPYPASTSYRPADKLLLIMMSERNPAADIITLPVGPSSLHVSGPQNRRPTASLYGGGPGDGVQRAANRPGRHSDSESQCQWSTSLEMRNACEALAGSASCAGRESVCRDRPSLRAGPRREGKQSTC